MSSSRPPQDDVGRGGSGSSWTTAADLRAQVNRLWDKGRLLATLADAELEFPLRLTLKAPSSVELAEGFDDVRQWSRALLREADGCRIVSREFSHRVFGRNALPAEAWLDSLDDAVRFIGEAAAARRFVALVASTRARRLELLPWLRAYPLRALSLADRWDKLLDLVDWMQAHPRPAIHIRQVDVPGIHTKFIEEHAGTLAELFELVMPADAVDASATGAARFAQRYGFCIKQPRVRFRMLDPAVALLGTGPNEDITVDAASFARLAPAVARVFITENEINFLAFPPALDALVIFGAGYGFDLLATAHWLHGKAIHYWGDIDTHGFAILDQLRGHFAHVESFLMDRATLLAHCAHWTDEPRPTLHDLARLNATERALFDDLRWRRLEDRQIRLEQERVGFHSVARAVEAIDGRLRLVGGAPSA